MQIFSSDQIQAIEAHTVETTKLSWNSLMHSAATEYVTAIISQNQISSYDECVILCGPGNNGGDGFVIGQIISQIVNIPINIYCFDELKNRSDLNILHLKNLTHNNNVNIYSVDAEYIIPNLSDSTLVVDAIFGIGINRPLSGLLSNFIAEINSSSAHFISVDIPSGMFTSELNNANNKIVKSNEIITFQYPKPSFFFDENLGAMAKCKIVDIGAGQKSRKTFLKLASD